MYILSPIIQVKSKNIFSSLTLDESVAALELFSSIPLAALVKLSIIIFYYYYFGITGTEMLVSASLVKADAFSKRQVQP